MTPVKKLAVFIGILVGMTTFHGALASISTAQEEVKKEEDEVDVEDEDVKDDEEDGKEEDEDEEGVKEEEDDEEDEEDDEEDEEDDEEDEKDDEKEVKKEEEDEANDEEEVKKKKKHVKKKKKKHVKKKGEEDEEEALMLTPYLDNGQVELAQIKSRVVKSLPCEWPASHSGFITVNKSLGNHMFFWHLLSPNPSAPLLIWLNGGPGLSSLLSLFDQHGPFVANLSSGRPEMRDHSLVGHFSVAYVDSPIGAGFSFSDSGMAGLRRNKKQYKHDLAQFMKQFVKLFPQYETLDVYLGGESYGGKFAIVAAKSLMEAKRHNETALNLKGVILGSPLFDPKTGAKHTAEYFFSMGMLTRKEMKDFSKKQVSTYNKFYNGTLGNEGVFQIFKSSIPINFGVINMFNVAVDIQDKYQSNKLDGFLNDDFWKKKLHVGKRKFTGGNWGVVFALIGDVRHRTPLRSILEENYKVLIYNGNFDGVVNTNSLEACIEKIKWPGRSDYINSSRTPWGVDGTLYGFYSTSRQLCRVVVQGEGVQVGFVTPNKVIAMMTQFESNGCVSPGKITPARF